MRLTLLLVLMVVLQTHAQNPYRHFTEAIDIRYDSKQPVIHYILEVDTANLSFINVEMRIGNIGDSCSVAMFVHPEYDDRFYRFIEELKIEKGSIERADKNLWSIHTTSREAVIHYKIHLPEDRRPRAAWKPFLSSTGALIGGPQCYMYVVGATLAPSYVHLRLPESWQTVTALEATVDPKTFFAPTAAVLFDSPILAGQLKQWSFDVDGVPHKILYWPSSNFKAFDTITLVSSIRKLVQQANQLFGRLPYRDYSFLLQDDATVRWNMPVVLPLVCPVRNCRIT
jgi:Peptidase M61 N-terminal domain